MNIGKIINNELYLLYDLDLVNDYIDFKTEKELIKENKIFNCTYSFKDCTYILKNLEESFVICYDKNLNKTIYLRDLVKINGDKIRSCKELLDNNKKYMSVFNYCEKNKIKTFDSFQYYNDYVIEIGGNK